MVNCGKNKIIGVVYKKRIMVGFFLKVNIYFRDNRAAELEKEFGKNHGPNFFTIQVTLFLKLKMSIYNK